MAVYDRWHKSHPVLDNPDPAKNDQPCREHSRGKTKLYPVKNDHLKGDRWQVRWRDPTLPPGKQQLKRNFSKKTGDDPDEHAEAFDAKNKRELDTGTSVDRKKGKTKLAEYEAAWRKDLLHRDSTAERMERVFRLHIDPFLGHLPIADIRPSHLRSWVKDRSMALAPSTLVVVFSNLSGLFNAAVLDRHIGISPCLGIQLPDVEHHSHYIPTPAQVHTVAETLLARHAAIPYLAAGCGLRGGEIMGMELGAVDFLRREVDVSQQLVCISGRPPYLGPLKTKTSPRTVELPTATAAALSEHLKRFEPVEVEIDDLTNPRKPTRRKAKLLFTTNMLNPIHRATWAHLWAPARDAAGIPPGNGLHCLRHYFATLLIHKGASVKTVQLALGHSTPMVTLNEYVGEWPEPHEKTRKIVDDALGLVPRVCPTKIAQ